MKYPKVLSQRDVLTLLRVKLYTVDVETGDVRNRKGKVITPFPDKEGRLFVRLYWNGHRKSVFVSRLVWMSVTNRVIPWGFEIHHRDEDHRNNAWDNLFCLAEKDHHKLHGRDLIDPKLEEVPF